MNNDCEDIRILLDAYHDGEAEPSERELVEHHIASCGECSRVLAEIAVISNSLRALPELSSKRDFSERFEEVLAARGNDTQSSCELIAPLLDAYYDNELEAAERELVARHLPGCDDCSRGLGEIERVVATLKQLAPVVPSRDFVENFETILAERTKVVWFKRRVVWASTSIAAAIALIIMVSTNLSGVAPTAVTANKPSALHSSPVVSQNSQSDAHSVSIANKQIAQKHAQAVPQHLVSNNSATQTTAQAATQSAANVASSTPSIKVANNNMNSSPAKNASALQVANSNAAAQQESIARQPVVNPLPGQVTANQTIAATSGVSGRTTMNGRMNGKGSLTLDMNGSEDLIALYDSDSSPAEELGLTTDEDGLYAIKL